MKCLLMLDLLGIDDQGEEAPEHLLNSLDGHLPVACDSESKDYQTSTIVDDKTVRHYYSGLCQSVKLMTSVTYVMQDLIACTCMLSM